MMKYCHKNKDLYRENIKNTKKRLYFKISKLIRKEVFQFTIKINGLNTILNSVNKH